MTAWFLTTMLAWATDETALPEAQVVVALAEETLDAVGKLDPETLAATVPEEVRATHEIVVGTVVRVACTDPWCLVVVDWQLGDGPDETVVRTSGGAKADAPRDALLAAFARAGEDLSSQLLPQGAAPTRQPPPQASLTPTPLPPPDPDPPTTTVTPTLSTGERWMVRGGYVVGAGAVLLVTAGYVGGEASNLMAASGGIAVLAGVGLAGVGLAVGFDEPVQFAPHMTRHGGPGLGLNARLPGRRRARRGPNRRARP